MVFIHEPDRASFSDRGERVNACEAMSDKVQLRVKMPRHAHPTFLQFFFLHGDVSSPSPFLQKVHERDRSILRPWKACQDYISLPRPSVPSHDVADRDVSNKDVLVA